MLLPESRYNLFPPVIKNLLIINGLMFLATIVFDQSFGINLLQMFGLHYFESDLFKIYQPITYLFMHGGFDHIFFNMLGIWIFGTAIENTWGSKRFLQYYLITGFGAAFLHYAIIAWSLWPVTSQIDAALAAQSAEAVVQFMQTHAWQEFISPDYSPSNYAIMQAFASEEIPQLAANPTNAQLLDHSMNMLRDYKSLLVNSPNVVGASGALYGVLIAFGMMFAERYIMMLFFPVPIKVKYLVIFYGVSELWSGFSNNPGDNVAHFAHLGGMLFGYLLIKFWQQSGFRWR